MTTEVRDSGGLHKYRTEIPNMVLDMGLDAYTFRLYCHLKRVAGDEGMCWQSTRTISEATNMSVGQVSKSKKVLEEKGLITCERGGPTTSDSVTIIDLWLRNMEVYSKRSQRSPHEHERSPDEHERSPHEPKKNHSKKNHVKNSRGASGEAHEELKANEFVAQWCERITQDCSGIYSESEKGRFARDVGNALKRGVSAGEIDEAIDRIIGRWDSIHLPLSEAIKDVSNGYSGSERPAPKEQSPTANTAYAHYNDWTGGKRH